MHLQDFAPEYSDADASTLYDSSLWFLNTIEENAGGDNGLDPKAPAGPNAFKMPVVLMMGRYDLQTPYLNAKQYFEGIEAPSKKFVTFERGAHFLMYEQPGLSLKALLDDVLPFTEGIAPFDVLPDAPVAGGA